MQGLITDLEDATQSLPGTIAADTVLQQISGWDSLALVSFIAAVHERYGLELTAEDLLECHAVADLHALLTQRMRSTSAVG